MAAVGDTLPTPVAKANAAAVCPDGNEREVGIGTWRATRHVARRAGRAAAGARAA